jgi:NAD-dependent deacetylase
MARAGKDSAVQEKIDAVARLLKDARSILFITGAGISADSGLPTYRGIGGLYNDAATDEGIPIETALAGRMLETRPEVTWKYLSQIEARCRSAKFNRAHEVIALAGNEFERVWVLTQNIDGLHHAAGSKNVIDIHGNMYDIYCAKCGWKRTLKDYRNLDIPPVCPQCRNVARPDVVFFGEMLSAGKCERLAEELELGFDLYFSIGTTSVFPYIAQPILNARYMRKPTIEINPAETEVSDFADIKLRMKAAEALDAIWNAYCGQRKKSHYAKDNKNR